MAGKTPIMKDSILGPQLKNSVLEPIAVKCASLKRRENDWILLFTQLPLSNFNHTVHDCNASHDCRSSPGNLAFSKPPSELSFSLLITPWNVYPKRTWYLIPISPGAAEHPVSGDVVYLRPLFPLNLSRRWAGVQLTVNGIIALKSIACLPIVMVSPYHSH